MSIPTPKNKVLIIQGIFVFGVKGKAVSMLPLADLFSKCFGSLHSAMKLLDKVYSCCFPQ